MYPLGMNFIRNTLSYIKLAIWGKPVEEVRSEYSRVLLIEQHNAFMTRLEPAMYFGVRGAEMIYTRGNTSVCVEYKPYDSCRAKLAKVQANNTTVVTSPTDYTIPDTAKIPAQAATIVDIYGLIQFSKLLESPEKGCAYLHTIHVTVEVIRKDRDASVSHRLLHRPNYDSTASDTYAVSAFYRITLDRVDEE